MESDSSKLDIRKVFPNKILENINEKYTHTFFQVRKINDYKETRDEDDNWP